MPPRYNRESMKSLFRLSGALAIVLVLSFLFAGSFASAPAADASTSLPTEFFGPGLRGLLVLEQKLGALEATVSGLAQSFTTQTLTATTGNFQTLCVTKSDGTPVCVTGDQLASMVAGGNQVSVQISGPTPPMISGTSAPPLVSVDTASSTATTTPPFSASSTPPSSLSETSSTASSTDATSTSQ
jgi:hypothetical protein